MPEKTDSRLYSSALLFFIFFVVIFLAHAPMLRLPYFWDEAGYYVPAARDLLLTGSLIPHSTPSNAHPPLVLAFLALAWKVFGYSPLVTRAAMLLIAAFSLLGLFRLEQSVANTEVAIAATICTAAYPVFFMQSMLAQVDLAAAGLTFWGLRSYVENRRWPAVAWFCAAVLAKETAILAPLALFGGELFLAFGPRIFAQKMHPPRTTFGSRLALLVPVIPLIVWYGYHYARTGFIFGNPEFFRYNVQATMQPLRILLALGLRCWQILGYLSLYVLTIAAMAAMWLPAIKDGEQERQRIDWRVQVQFLLVTAAYVVVMAVIGGAVLARYMLPVVPLVIIVSVSTLRRRVRRWRWVVGLVTLSFVAALFVNPPYGFSIEDNLACRDYIQMHQRAEAFLEAHYLSARVLTAWPASDEITRPYLGYVAKPMQVLRVEDFTAGQLIAVADQRGFEVALVFSTKYEPQHSWFQKWRTWTKWKTEFFGYHRDVPPAAAAQMLGGKLAYEERRPGQWVAIIEMPPSSELSKNGM